MNLHENYSLGSRKDGKLLGVLTYFSNHVGCSETVPVYGIWKDIS